MRPSAQSWQHTDEQERLQLFIKQGLGREEEREAHPRMSMVSHGEA